MVQTFSYAISNLKILSAKLLPFCIGLSVLIRYQGPDSIQICRLTSIGNPVVEIRRSYDRLISTMGFPIYQYRKSHCGDQTILRPSYLHNGISYTGKTASLYWIAALCVVFSTVWQEGGHTTMVYTCTTEFDEMSRQHNENTPWKSVPYYRRLVKHYDDVTWTPCCLKSPVIQLFV